MNEIPKVFQGLKSLTPEQLQIQAHNLIEALDHSAGFQQNLAALIGCYAGMGEAYGLTKEELIDAAKWSIGQAFDVMSCHKNT